MAFSNTPGEVTGNIWLLDQNHVGLFVIGGGKRNFVLRAAFIDIDLENRELAHNSSPKVMWTWLRVAYRVERLVEGGALEGDLGGGVVILGGDMVGWGVGCRKGEVLGTGVAVMSTAMSS